LHLQKSIHVPLCIQAILNQIDIIILPIPFVKTFDTRTRKTAAFKAPLEALLKSASLFDTIPATFPGDFLIRRSAAGTWLLTDQMCAARKAVYTAWRNHARSDLFRHSHKASPP